MFLYDTIIVNLNNMAEVLEMKKNKFYAVFLIIIFILSGCETGHKSAGKNSAAGLKTGTTQAVSDKQQKIQEPVYESSKANKTSERDESSVKVKEIGGFVMLSSLDKDIIIDLRYATAHNFTKKLVYPDNICVLRKGTAEKLVKANAQLEKLGYRIKVWDAYRPVYVQKIFWNLVKDSRFVANPYTGGSIHNRGCAVDITLVKSDGSEVTMPSDFDDFSAAAYRTNTDMKNEAKKNLDLLTECMIQNGFKTIDTEWWHFEDTDSKNYKIADIDLKLFK